MNYFKINNNILNTNLSIKELYCYIYLSSIYSDIKGVSGNWIAVKQSTIAWKCGIKTEQTVGRITASLMKKGYITNAVRRKNSLNGTLGTYCYIIKKPSFEDGFFFVDRKVFDLGLTPKQFLIYLFMCRAFSAGIGFSWNSYNDIAKAAGIERSDVVKAVKQLVLLGLIIRQKVKSRSNKKVYVDNRYFIVRFEKGFVAKKLYKPSKKRRAPSRQRKALINNSYTYFNTGKRKSQGVLIEYDIKYELNPDLLVLEDTTLKLLEARILKPKRRQYSKLQQEAIIAFALGFTQIKLSEFNF